MAGKSRPLEHDGRTQSVSAWARETGLPASTITSRIAAGWSVADAIGCAAEAKFNPRGRKRIGISRPCPRLRKHRVTGQAMCAWSDHGKRQYRYFGPWGSAEADTAYRRFQVEWIASQSSPLADLEPGEVVTVAAVGIRWLAHCEVTYVKRGKVTSEVNLNRAAWRVVGQLYGDIPAREFTPKKLKSVQIAMVAKDWSRDYVNAQITRIQRAFAWAVGDELIEPNIAEALQYVDGLAAGRTKASEREPKTPIPVEHIEAIREHLHEDDSRRMTLWAMVGFQRLAGLRPGEVCSIRPEDIDKKHGDLWRFESVEFNKMLHRETRRVLWIGPRAQEVIAPFLATATTGQPIFRLPPRYRVEPLCVITTRRYRDCIETACKAAGVPVWNPHRLRHTRATEVQRIYESDTAAAAAIGDTPEVARQVYVERPGDAVAKRIAREVG